MERGGVRIDFTPNGSGKGISCLIDHTCDFAASDALMTADQYSQVQANGEDVVYIPMVLGDVAFTYNLPGYDTPLNLSRDVLVRIFLAESAVNYTDKDGNPLKPILKWNDPDIIAINPELANMPDLDLDQSIIIVVRDGSSGTTKIVTSYLESANPNTWGSAAGPRSGTAIEWPKKDIAGKTSADVAKAVQETPYSFSYLEIAYILQLKMQYALVENLAGKYISPTCMECVSSAALGVDIPENLQAIIVNGDGQNTYPVSAFTWIIVYVNQKDLPKALTIINFLWWATHEAKVDLEGYAAVPSEMLPLIEAQLNRVMYNGQSVVSLLNLN
jgi:phosphate transport system substrate-binding protein